MSDYVYISCRVEIRGSACPPSTPPPGRHHPSAPTAHTSCTLLRDVSNLEHRCVAEKARGDRLKLRGDTFEQKLRNSTKQAKRAVESRSKAQEGLRVTKQALDTTTKQLTDRLSQHAKAWALAATVQDKRLKNVVSKLVDARKRAKLYHRYNKSLTQQIEQLVGATRKHSLLKKGVYTGASRRLMRQLAALGCSASRIVQIMHLCADSYGVKLIGNPSARQVGRAVIEGLIAAKIQAGQEVLDADGEWLVSCTGRPAHLHLIQLIQV